MKDNITITIPEIKETINALETATAHEHDVVTEALAAIRKNYAPLAKHNGYVRIAYSYRGSNSSFYTEKNLYYEQDGKKIRALLVINDFVREYEEQNRGTLSGSNLYLTETGEWLLITREGNWTAWQNEPEGWGCGVCADDRVEPGVEPERCGGKIEKLTDAEVEERYDIEQVCERLSKSLADLAQKLPERLTRVQKRIAIALQLLAALKG